MGSSRWKDFTGDWIKSGALVLIICSVFFYKYQTTVDLDIWARLAVGKLIFENHGPVATDIFAYTPKKDKFIDHEWGSSVVFYGAASLFGGKGLFWLSLCGFLFVLLLLHLTVVERQGKPAAFPLYLFALWGITFGFVSTVRSHLFTYCFFALWIYLLERARNEKNGTLILIPLTMLFWANMHGGFVAGLGLIGMYGTAAFIEKKPYVKYMAVLISSLGITLVNPYGFDYWTYLFHALTMSRPRIPEWWPLQLLGPIKQHLAYKTTFFIVVITLMLRKTRSPRDLILLSVTALMGLRHVRHFTFFCLVAFPYLAESYQNRHSGWISRKWWHKLVSILTVKVRIVLNACLMAGILVLIFSGRFDIPRSNYLPERATAFIMKNHLKGRLLTQFNWGSYAIWRLFPQCRVSLDGRYEEVYTDRTYFDIEFFTNGEPGWDRALRCYRHDLILIRRNSRIVSTLRNLRKLWIPVYQDERAVIYVPAGTEDVPWIDIPEDYKEKRDPFSTKGKPAYLGN